MKPSSALHRWVVNVAIAIVVAAALNLASVVAGLWGDAWSTSPAGVLLAGTFLTFVYWVLLPSVALLLLVELASRLVKARVRGLAVVIGACLAALYLVLLVEMWHFVDASAAVIVAAAAVGAVYGGLVRLPPAGAVRQVTFADAE